MKNKRGCEIEARGLSYVIGVPRRPQPFKIWSRDEEDDEEDNNGGISVLEDSQKIDKNGGGVRHVLKNVNCRAKPWEMLAVVGPSGAGKSTLLQILAGRLPPQSSPAVFADGKPIDGPNYRKLSGYVSQHDALFPLLTVRETLACAAALRLRLPSSEIEARVESLISELGLANVADTRVGGGGGVRGISGGERRRVSIGVGVVHDPAVLILDEPTSGLDSAAALQVVHMLRDMAETRGRTVILTIHQPGFCIVKLFHSILLLANGDALFHGTVNGLNDYLFSAGLEIPPHVNVVEFAVDSIESLQHAALRKRCTLIQLFQISAYVDEEACLHSFAAAVDDDGSGGGDYANTWITETAILARRFFKIVFRTKQLFACRTVQMLVAGGVLGSIFYNLDNTVAGAREKIGLFAFILTFLLSCTTEALPIFLQEREILMNEIGSGSYRVSSYAIANALIFIPFLLILSLLFSTPCYWLVGLNRSLYSFSFFVLLIWLILYTANSVALCVSALAPNFIIGNSMISGVMGSFFLFSGYFISKHSMPGYWVFMHYMSLFKYPFEAFLVNEFAGKCLEIGAAGGVCVMNGDDVLGEEGMGDSRSGRWKNVGMMVGFIVAYRFIAYVILRWRCRWSEIRGGGRRRKALLLVQR